MFLRRIEIAGFKSFAQRTVLDFSPKSTERGSLGEKGITAIVGPNGSGKSNVADAIRWTLGEQSTKNLRGKKSEDVIFAGTAKKAKVGTASVTLFFENLDHRIPIEYEEVSISRKLHRSGESEFLINGAKVRLLDIADLLAKAGIGKDSYSVITQGMSDAVLSATPLERRSIFEDAAGVKQYQLEKERSLRKLAATRENLAQASIIIAEIEPRLRVLKRQAERAAQGKEVSAALLSKQAELYGFLWHSFQAERETVSKEREKLALEVGLLERKTDTLRAERKRLSASLEEGDDGRAMEKANSLREAFHGVERQVAVLEGRINLEQERQKDREEVRAIPVDMTYVRTGLGRVRGQQELLIEKLEKEEKDEEAVRKQARLVCQDLIDLDLKVAAGTITEKVILSLPEEERKASDRQLASFRTERASLVANMEALRADIEVEEEKIRTDREKGRESREKYFEMEKNLREGEGALSAMKDALNELKVRMARIEVREEDLVHEVREELSMDVKELSWDGVPRDKDALSREVARLKGESERIGALDPFVVEEYEETKKRFEFLTAESADLTQAMKSLETVIAEMEARIEKEFSSAFSEIAAKFEHYFSLIFNGGKASLVKTRPRPASLSPDDAPLSDEVEQAELGAGIDILACPPGKKITNLSMLSGGERSLTSLALLFAIISHNPPPFAVLDEVEAALDEANSKRFGKVLKELAGETQFIVITHNRQTMREASLLYGVTMGEDGVSQILSLHLEEAEKVREEGKKK